MLMYKCALVNVARSVNAKPARGDKYKGPVCPIHNNTSAFVSFIYSII